MSMAGMIVGLGNPGSQYMNTRHNLGFAALDALLRHAQQITPLGKNKFKAELWQARFAGHPDPWLLVKPQTFMNLSGESVQPLAAWHRLEPEQILVIHDEVDILPGRMKFKQGGGNAGHNGLKSITERLGTPDFWRLRLGVGRSPHGGEMVNWVLGRLSEAESGLFERMLPTLLEVTDAFIRHNTVLATRLANGYKEETPTAQERKAPA